MALRTKQPLPLDQIIAADSEIALGGAIEDRESPSPQEAAERRLLCEGLRSLLQALTDRERRVIELRFGLRDDRPRTATEVGTTLGLTRQRIRHIETSALAHLRQAGDRIDLQAYLL